MRRMRRFDGCSAAFIAILAAATLLAACEGPDDDGGYDVFRPDRDAGQDDADVTPDADADTEDAAVDADVPAGDADAESDGDVEETDPREELALCLADMGAVLYGAYWCGACRYQRLQFAPYHELINYVDCYFDPELGILAEPKEECQDVELVEEDGTVHGIEAFPTWTFDDNPHYIFFVGATDMPTLAEVSGCPWLGEPGEE